MDFNADVSDDEVLYRSIKASAVMCDNEGRFSIGTEAFLDRARRPSVNRAALDGYDPTRVRKSESDYVGELLTDAVRKTTFPYNQPVENPAPNAPKLVSIEVRLDVLPDPIDESNRQEGEQVNLAHAVIVSSVDNPGSSAYQKMRERLVEICAICLTPDSSSNDC